MACAEVHKTNKSKKGRSVGSAKLNVNDIGVIVKK